MKVAQQYVMDEEDSTSDAPTKQGSSVLGKYIIGAKNNFRGFNTRQDDKKTSLKVIVHSKEKEVENENHDSEAQVESDIQQNQEGGWREEWSKQVTDCDVVRMEEDQAQAEQEEQKEIEEEEQEEADKNATSINEVKQEKTEGSSFTVEIEATDEEAEKISEGETEEHTTVTFAHADSDEKTETKKIISKFEEIELQERKAAQPSWMKGRKPEENVEEKPHDGKSNETPETKKMISSPTGSSSSHDTGFGSQDEGSIDGAPMRL